MQRATKPETHKGPAKGPAGIDTARDSTQSRRDSSREAQTETQTALALLYWITVTVNCTVSMQKEVLWLRV